MYSVQISVFQIGQHFTHCKLIISRPHSSSLSCIYADFCLGAAILGLFCIQNNIFLSLSLRAIYPGSEVPKSVEVKTTVRRTSERRGRNLWSPWTITSFWSLSDCMSNCFVKTNVAPQFDYKNCLMRSEA